MTTKGDRVVSYLNSIRTIVYRDATKADQMKKRMVELKMDTMLFDIMKDNEFDKDSLAGAMDAVKFHMWPYRTAIKDDGSIDWTKLQDASLMKVWDLLDDEQQKGLGKLTIAILYNVKDIAAHEQWDLQYEKWKKSTPSVVTKLKN